MSKSRMLFAVFTALAVVLSCSRDVKSGAERTYNSSYSGDNLAHISYPIGGMGTGMFCIEGNGGFSAMSLHHVPDLFNDPCTFAAIHVDGYEKGSRVLESVVPSWKEFGRRNTGQGNEHTTYGLPRFSDGSFSARFPFAEVSISDPTMPVSAVLTAWNPFIPNDEDNSSLPVGALEYTITNTSGKALKTVFSFNSRNFMITTPFARSEVRKMENGFVFHQDGTPDEPWQEGDFAVFTDAPGAVVDCAWFRGGWWDPLTMAWNHAQDGDLVSNEPKEGSLGASIYVPVELASGESRTVNVLVAWYVPDSKHHIGKDAVDDNDRGDHYDAAAYKDMPPRYKPWYSTRFAGVSEVASYWLDNYKSLREKTKSFTDAFYDSSLPAEVQEAVAANLTILKSTTVMRQHDGRLWNWEGSGDTWGSCHGTCEHVWNYAQAIPHLFPRMERTLRETEYFVSQAKDGHQQFRTNLPIRPVHHDFHSAADGQLGGIIKLYRDWKISGDNAWLAKMYPQAVKSIDYCIELWDPRHTGALEEPHHNTYDIEFWGPDGMCSSIYAGALEAMVGMGTFMGEDVSVYASLLGKSKEYIEGKLFNGEYFYQDVRWKGLRAKDPTTIQMIYGGYSDEARAILAVEGPKYQYGTGCLSDGVLGCWMSLVSGLDEPYSSDKVRSHLNSVYKYNLKKDLYAHANPQRNSYAMGHDGGLLLCSWPNGGKPRLPFVYSDEVWTGIEYQVAAHLIFEGEVEKGLEIVRTCRDRYDGRFRNPFNEYECGNWYARALASYSLLQALTGVRYDAVEKTLYINSKVGNFRSFLSTASGYGTVSLKGGKPSLNVVEGAVDVLKCIVDGEETELVKS